MYHSHQQMVTFTHLILSFSSSALSPATLLYFSVYSVGGMWWRRSKHCGQVQWCRISSPLWVSSHPSNQLDVHQDARYVSLSAIKYDYLKLTGRTSDFPVDKEYKIYRLMRNIRSTCWWGILNRLHSDDWPLFTASYSHIDIQLPQPMCTLTFPPPSFSSSFLSNT